MFILIRLIMNGTIRVLNSGMCTGGTALIAHSGFPPCFLKGGVVLGSGGLVSGLIHIIIKKVQPSMYSLFLYLFATGREPLHVHACYSNFIVFGFNSSHQWRKNQNNKNIHQKLFSVEIVYLWSIFSFDRIHTPSFGPVKVQPEKGNEDF